MKVERQKYNYLCTCKFNGLVHLGPKKVEIRGPNPPRFENCPPEKIMHRAVKFTGALVVLCPL